MARGVDVEQVLELLVVELAEHLLAQHLGEADDRVERRAQLVRHVGEELRLVLVGQLELPALVLDLVEQARVLDRDHRLVGEGLQQADLLVGEAGRRLARRRRSRRRARPSQSIGAKTLRVAADRPASGRSSGPMPARRGPAARRRYCRTAVLAQRRPERSDLLQREESTAGGSCARRRDGRRAAGGRPRRRAWMPCSVLANRRSQLSRILSKTGCVSATELLMTWSTSAGRRLLLERLLRLVEEARVLDRDDRLVGEGLEQRDLLVRELAPGSERPTQIAPMPWSSLSSGAKISDRGCPVRRRTPADVLGHAFGCRTHRR